MGDVRFERQLARVRDAPDPVRAIRGLDDHEVVSALAAASVAGEAYLANVLATEAQNRMRRASALHESVAEAVLVVDLDGRIERANAGAERLLDRPVADLVGRGIHDVGHSDGDSGCPLRQALQSGEAAFSDLTSVRTSEGTRVPTETRVSPLRDTEGRVEGALVLIQDISERRNEEEALRARDVRLERENWALVALAKRIGRESLDTMLRTLAETSARTLDVARVGIWLFDDEHATLRCARIYDVRSAAMPLPESLRAERYPRYFGALERELAIPAADAVQDERTSELAEDYLLPNGVGALLDAPIRLEGRIVGVICHEHFGGPRPWTTDEEQFAGSIASIVALVLEAERRERAQAALRDSEARHRAIVDAADRAGVGVVLYLGEGDASRIVFASDAVLRILGVTRAELHASDPLRHVPEEERKRLREWASRKARGEPTPSDFQTVVERPDGKLVPVEVALGRAHYGDKEATVALVRDVSSRVRAERAARESEASRRAVVTSAPVILFALDASGTITMCEGRALDALGIDGAALVGRSVFHDFPVDGQWVEEARRALRGETFVSREKRGDVVFETNWAPLLDEEGAIVGTVGVALDVSARTRALEALRESQERLEGLVTQRTSSLRDAYQDLESFTYSVSHDLRAPLRGIDSLAEVLEEDFHSRLGDEGVAVLAQLRRESGRARRLVDDLLVLSRVGRGDMRREPMDLTALARESVARLRQAEPARAVHVEVQEGLRAHADAGLVRVVLDNLLGNAWKFTRGAAQPRIRLGAQTQDGTTAYFVEDNGAGFDPAQADRLFRPFERLHTASQFEGTGIGLATVRRIVERHGGRVWAEGRLGRGATFWFTLGAEEGGREEGASGGEAGGGGVDPAPSAPPT